MKIIVALLFTLIASQASADGFAYLEERVGTGTVSILLSDMVLEPTECDFNGLHGFVGRVAIRGPFGNVVDQFDGCWRLSEDSDAVLFTTKNEGNWELHRFRYSQFTLLK